MKHVETQQKTLGKKTRALIKTLCPSAVSIRKVANSGAVVRDRQGNCLCTWAPRRGKNGLIVIHD